MQQGFQRFQPNGTHFNFGSSWSLVARQEAQSALATVAGKAESSLLCCLRGGALLVKGALCSG